MNAQARHPTEPISLRTRILRHIWVPLVLTWLMATVFMMALASHFTEQAFDRAVLDDAYAIASHLRIEDDGQVRLALTPSELQAALFDQAENVYFAVYRPDGTHLQGGALLPDMELPPGEDTDYREFFFEGQLVRAVVLRVPLDGRSYKVVMAHTTHMRDRLSQHLFLYAAFPQLALLVLLLLWLRHNIGKDLRPLTALQAGLAHRDAHDLRPVQTPPPTREIAELTQAINGLMDRLGRSLRAQSEFAGDVAHELRNPLAGIRALADYGAANADPAVWHQQLLLISSHVERASHMVDQLLAIAQADESSAVRRKPLCAASVLQQAVLRNLEQADRAGVDLGARGIDDDDAEQFHILADASLLDAMLDNLVHNALRYGGRTVTLELSVHAQHCHLDVVDDGPGIAADERAALMQRWSQGEDGQAMGEGAGLGLAIVARFARLQGASFVLEPLSTEPGAAVQGLRASLQFPRAQPQ